MSQMTPERWDRINQILRHALRLDEAQRADSRFDHCRPDYQFDCLVVGKITTARENFQLENFQFQSGTEIPWNY